MRKFLVTATLAAMIADLLPSEAMRFGETSTAPRANVSARVVQGAPAPWKIECWDGNSGRPHCNA